MSDAVLSVSEEDKMKARPAAEAEKLIFGYITKQSYLSKLS
jgi:hypothetical protein